MRATELDRNARHESVAVYREASHLSVVPAASGPLIATAECSMSLETLISDR